MGDYKKWPVFSIIWAVMGRKITNHQWRDDDIWQNRQMSWTCMNLIAVLLKSDLKNWYEWMNEDLRSG